MSDMGGKETEILTKLYKYLTGVHFINVCLRTFFVQNFVQSQNVARKKAFVQKICTKSIDEIDTSGQFHQRFSRTFFVQIFCQS